MKFHNNPSYKVFLVTQTVQLLIFSFFVVKFDIKSCLYNNLCVYKLNSIHIRDRILLIFFY